MPLEVDGQFGIRFGIPEINVATRITRGDPFSIGTEESNNDMLIVSSECFECSSCFCVPEDQRAVPA